MAKWNHKLPKHFSNTAAVTDLNWPSMRARDAVRKLSIMRKVAETRGDTLRLVEW